MFQVFGIVPTHCQNAGYPPWANPRLIRAGSQIGLKFVPVVDISVYSLFLCLLDPNFFCGVCSQLSIMVLPISRPTGLDRGWGLPEKKHLGIPLLLSVLVYPLDECV